MGCAGLPSQAEVVRPAKQVVMQASVTSSHTAWRTGGECARPSVRAVVGEVWEAFPRPNAANCGRSRRNRICQPV